MYTIYGRVKYQDKDGNCKGFVTGGWVQPYFKKVDSGSSESKWATRPYDLDPINEGYYSLDIEDFDLLGPEGIYRKGQDKFYLAFFWDTNNPNNKDRNSSTISYAALVEHTLKAGTDDVELNITLSEVKGPQITSKTFPSSPAKTMSSVTMKETSSIDESFSLPTGCGSEYSKVQTSQKKTYNGETVFGSYVPAKTEYSWDESTDPITVTSTGTSTNSHTYTTSGIKDLSIKTFTEWGGFEVITNQLRVEYNTPIVDFNYSIANPINGKIYGPDEITFSNLTSDLDSRFDSYTYEWVIEDKNPDNSNKTEIISNKNFKFSPSYQFLTPGTKTIKLRCYWNNGFSDLIEEKVKTIVVNAFIVTGTFTWDKIASNRNELVTFSANLSGDTSKIVSVDWVISDNWPLSINNFYTFSDSETSLYGEGSSDNQNRVDNTYTVSNELSPSVKFHSNEAKDIICSITYFNGWEDISFDVTKKYVPNTLVLVPSVNFSTKTPVGRTTEVTFSNTTANTASQYKVEFDVIDFYSENNIDNPIPAVKTDNNEHFEETLDLNKIFSHAFQNTSSDNTVTMTLQYDNGWQQVTTTTSSIITPKKHNLPIVDFNWTPTIPNSREVEISLQNITNNIDNLLVDLWYDIEEEFDLYNPNNPMYGVSITARTLSISTDSPEFKSQTVNDTKVVATYKFDDGFEYVEVNKEHYISKDDRSLSVNFIVDEQDIIGKSIKCSNTSSGDAIQLNAIWTFIDRNGLNNDSELVTTLAEDPSTEITFDWKSPSRRPYSTSSNPATVGKENKTIDLEIQYDNGWSDNNYESESFDVEARTNEIDSISISFDNEPKYGKSEIPFTLITGNESHLVPNSVYWEIVDEDPEGNDTSLNLFNKSLIEVPTKIFQSVGSKLIIAGIKFDDGYGNQYINETSTYYEIFSYLEPNFDFNWTPERPASNRDVTISLTYEDEHPKGLIQKVYIDYNNDGEFDSYKSEVNGTEVEIFDSIRPAEIKFKYIRTEGINEFKVVVEWSDGWITHRKELIKELVAGLLPPVINLSINQVYGNNYKLEIDATDPDGDIKDYKYEIYFKNPVMNVDECRNPDDKKANKNLQICSFDELFGNYVKIFESDWFTDEISWKRFSSNGYYKIVAWARDEDDLTSSDIKELYIEACLNTEEPTPTPTECITCTKRCIGGVMRVYPFSVSVIGRD